MEMGAGSLPTPLPILSGCGQDNEQHERDIHALIRVSPKNESVLCDSAIRRQICMCFV